MLAFTAPFARPLPQRSSLISKSPPVCPHTLSRQTRPLAPTAPAPSPAVRRPAITCELRPPQVALRLLSQAAAAIVLSSLPLPMLPLSPLPVAAAPLNSAPLRFQQSLLQDDAAAPTKLQAQWDVKSVNSQTETFLMFSNDSPSTVDLWWIDYLGHEVYYASISPGTTHMQPSYATHPWVVRDHISQNSMLVLVAGVQPALAVVDKA